MSAEAVAALDVDHFRAYNVSAPPIDLAVEVRGPFDNGEFQPITLRSLDHFANPVNKNREGIVDPMHHQTWYQLEERREPSRQVGICNQFGDQDLELREASLLLVPAIKLERGMEAPGLPEYNHYLCYRVDGSRGLGRQTVTLIDQFIRRDRPRQVIRPFFFGVPVAKAYAGQVEEVVDENAYLTIYEITPREIELDRVALDQFGEHAFSAVSTALLAVPTVLRENEAESAGPRR